MTEYPKHPYDYDEDTDKGTCNLCDCTECVHFSAEINEMPCSDCGNFYDGKANCYFERNPNELN